MNETYKLAVAVGIGIIIGMIIRDNPSYCTAALEKAKRVDHVISECQAKYPKDECVLVSMPVTNE